MPWYFYAIIGPLLWAIVNQIDKFLIARFYKKEKQGTEQVTNFGSLILFSAFFGIFVDTPDQKKTYKRLNKMFKILYQSPVLVNPGNQREYFIVIWLNEKP